MLPLDLTQYSAESRNDLCMSFYRGLERMMATPDGRAYIEQKTAELQTQRLINHEGGETQ